MPWHLLQLSHEQFVKNNKSISDTIIDKYIVYERVGSGAFGSVYRGMDDQTKKQVAIKVLDLVAIDRQESSQKVKEIRKRLAKTQSELMMRVQSDHVMKLFDVYENKWLKIMVVEYCNGGTLSDQISQRKKIPESEAIEILKQIILGIADMHKLNIIHRDLKTDNIMSHMGIYKIVDLGFAKQVPNQAVEGTVLGTIITMAPEVMRKEKYGLKADIWSVGIIFYEMLYGRLPYEPMKSADMYEQIIKKDIFPNGGKINGVLPSKEALTLMKCLLTVDQNKRIGWEELVNSDLFKSKKGLPESYRMTVDIEKLKAAKVTERKQEEIIQRLEDIKIKINQEKIVKLEKLNQKQKQKKVKEVDKTEINMVQWAVANHLECLKTQLIFRDIIQPIEQRKILNLSERRSVQFMYLLSSRCFINMSFVLNDFVDSSNPIVTNLKKTVQALYKDVSRKFETYCVELKKQEDKISSIVGDRFGKIFKSESIKTKDKFLTGIENIEFKKEEQIWFTYENYIKQLLPEMKEKDIVVKAKMQKYKEINDISLKDLNNKKFYDKVEEIIHNYVSGVKQDV